MGLKWSSHLNTSDAVLWDISPKSIGNISFNGLPSSYTNYSTYYKELEGGDIDERH